MATPYLNAYAQVEEQEGFLQKTRDWFALGIADSVISGGVSFLNTGIALGNVLGSEMEEIHTDEVIGDMLGDSHQQYYNEHQQGADLGGLIIGSFLPGTLAIRGARALSLGIAGTKTSRFATGLRELATPDSAVAMMRKQIGADALGRLGTAHKMKLFAANAGQQAFELAAFELGTLATMNQNSALNHDDLGYFDSFAANLTHAPALLLFGGAIGGAMKHWQHTREIDVFFRDRHLDAVRDVIPSQPASISIAGDRAAVLQHDLGKARTELEELSRLPKEAQQSAAHRRNYLEGSIQKLETDFISAINKASRTSDGDHNYGKLLDEMMTRLNMTTQQRVEMLSRTTQFGKAVAKMPTRKGLRVVASPEEGQLGLFDEVAGASSAIRLDAEQKLATVRAAISTGTVTGDYKAFQELSLDVIGELKSRDIAKLWAEDSKVRVALQSAEGKKFKLANFWDREAQAPDFIKLREMGILLPRLGKGKTYTPDMKLSTQLNLQQSLVNLRAEFDPAFQTLNTTWKGLHDEVQAGLAAGKQLDAELMEKYGKTTFELVGANNPGELFSFAFRTFNAAELKDPIMQQATKLGGKYNPLYQWMNNNAALKRNFGYAEHYVDRMTGATTTDIIAPLAVDMGVLAINKSGVQIGGKDFIKFRLGGTKELTTVEASSHFSWAESMHGAGAALGKVLKSTKAELPVGDLPLMQAVLAHHGFEAPIKIAMRDGKIETIASKDQLYAHVVEEKRMQVLDYAKVPGGEGRLASEVAALTDTTENFVLAAQSGAPEELLKLPASDVFMTKFHLLSEDAGKEVFLPKHIRFRTDKNSVDKLGEAKNSLVDTYTRMQSDSIYQESYAVAMLGVHNSKFPITTRTPQGIETWVTPINTASDTTSLLGAMSPRVFEAESIVQAISKGTHETQLAEATDISTLVAPEIRAAIANQDVLMEGSILFQSVLRTGKYQFFDPEVIFSGVPREVAMLDNLLGINIQKEIEHRLLKLAGVDANNIDRALVIEDAVWDMRAALSKLNQEVDLAAFQNILPRLRELATNPELQAQLAAMKQDRMGKLNAVIEELRPIFGATYREGQNKVFHVIQHKETADAIRVGHQANKQFVLSKMKHLSAAEQRAFNINPDVIHPGKLDTSKYQHIAFVRLKKGATDPWTIRDQGVIIGKDQTDLTRKIEHFKSSSRYNPNEVEIIPNRAHQDWLKANREYQSELAISETKIDSELRKDGKLWDTTPQFNPHVFSEWINGIVQQNNMLISRAVKLKYNSAFGTLDHFHKSMIARGAIHEGSAEASAFEKMQQQMLAIADTDSHLWYHTAQEKADRAFSSVVNGMDAAWTQLKTRGDWETFSKLSDHYGLPKVMDKGAEAWIMSNHPGNQQLLRASISQANSAFSFLMLRGLEVTHALVTAMSVPLSLHPAMKALEQQTAELIAESAQRFPDRMNILSTGLLDSSGRRMPSSTKLSMQAIRNYYTKGDQYIQPYIDHGIVGSDVSRLHRSVDAISYRPSSEFMDNVKKFADILSTPVDSMEKFARFVVADATRQHLDALGIPMTHQLYWPTINTLTNNVMGNYYRSQRPQLFQGWAGSAIGLFQTYSFNIFQQFSKYVGDRNQAAAWMAGLQVGTFGVQSVPGFRILNQYIGEKTEGNEDFYSLASASFDQPVVDFLVYGAGSALTRPLLDSKGLDFYSRGNLNPRTAIVIPTSLDEVPAAKFLANSYGLVANTLGAIAPGHDFSVEFAQAMAHNGLNRPLQGAFQLAMGEKTTASGTTMYKYEQLNPLTAQDWNYATVVAKLMGTRTMDEAIATDAFYRSQGYRAVRLQELASIGKTVRAQIRGSDGITPGEMEDVMRQYAEAGGNMRTFKRWMQNNYASASEPAINSMYQAVTSPEGRYMQSIMGAGME